MLDLVVIGGGVNGCGIARDAAGRGLSVLLAERDDLAGATSSGSTKLIHGGLRYLETCEFRLVAEALSEREVLWAMAPHIIRPLRFVLPHHAGLRPAILIRLGLWLYDTLGGRQRLARSRSIDLATDPAGAILRPEFRRAFEYADCQVDDARLVVLNARDAADRGADIRVRTEVVGAERRDGVWQVSLREVATGEGTTVSARMLVNAAGPWVGELSHTRLPVHAPIGVRLVKGSHIVVPRLNADPRAFIFQNADRRVVFAIPYDHDFTLIGTTDVEFTGDPRRVSASADEIAYLCAAVSGYLRRAVTSDEVVWSYAAVRALHDDGVADARAVTRDFSFELEDEAGQAPLLNVIGGKITTYRRLAEDALKKLAPWLGETGPAWTRGATLPGGNLPVDGLDALAAAIRSECAWLPEPLSRRLVGTYGTRARAILEGCRGLHDLGYCFGGDLFEREVSYLMQHEWARTADDVLWRRTKLGLRLDAAAARDLDLWMGRITPRAATPSASA